MSEIRINNNRDVYKSFLNAAGETELPNQADALIDVDSVELSGMSQAALAAVRSSGKVHVYDDDCDDLFKAVDVAIKELKKQSEDFAKYMEKYRENQRRQKKIQNHKARMKAALMKKSGLLWTSELDDSARQYVMSKSPQLFAEFDMKQKRNKQKDEDEE